MLYFYLWVFAHAAGAATISLLILKPLKQMLRRAGAVRVNFRQREVINMAGILIVFVWMLLMALVAVFPALIKAIDINLPNGFVLSLNVAMPLTAIIIGAGLFGLIDDLLGNRESTGFKGHIGELIKGRLTTGGLKAIGITSVALLAAAFLSNNIFEIIGNAALIALFVNTVNLLDLRPGRALKFYIPLQLLLAIAGIKTLGTSSAALLGIALVMIGPDLKEEVMLGDTGSNILGGVLGFCLAAIFEWNIKLPVIILLLVLQLLTEKFSISEVIERTPALRAIDNFGRRVD